MFFAKPTTRGFAGRLAAIVAALALAGCDMPATSGGSGPRIEAGAPVQVALLVPGGGGGDAVVSRSLENAARLAIADLNSARIDLRVYETGGNAGGGSAAATRAVDEGARIIVGPLYSAAANAAGVAVADKGVNVLSFSNNASIAGGNVFVLGSTFDNTANRLVRYAASHGRGNIFVVSAQSTAEQVGRDAIVRAAGASRARLAGSASFELSQQGLNAATPQIAQQIRASGANAVFFTSDNAGAMPYLAQLLPDNGIAPPGQQFIGLARLDIPPEALSQPGLQGAWLALPDPATINSFNARYSAAYGSAPHPLAGLAYDGIAAVGALISSGRSSALSKASLTQGSGFAGVNGVFRLLPNGTNERGLAVGQIRNNQVTIIDSAPRSFGGFGF